MEESKMQITGKIYHKMYNNLLDNLHVYFYFCRLTDDISIFASSVAHLYSHITKPCFDLMLIALALTRSSKKMQANFISGILLLVYIFACMYDHRNFYLKNIAKYRSTTCHCCNKRDGSHNACGFAQIWTTCLRRGQSSWLLTPYPFTNNHKC